MEGLCESKIVRLEENVLVVLMVFPVGLSVDGGSLSPVEVARRWLWMSGVEEFFGG